MNFFSVVLQHNAAQMQQLVIDMALHIGDCKRKGWQLQEAVAETETAKDLELLIKRYKINKKIIDFSHKLE